MKKRRWEKKAWRRRTEQKPGEKGHKTRRWCVNPRRVKMQTGRRAPTRRELTNIRTINSALIPNPRGNFCEASFFFYALTSFSTKTFCLWTPGGAFEHNRCVPVCVCVCVSIICSHISVPPWTPRAAVRKIYYSHYAGFISGWKMTDSALRILQIKCSKTEEKKTWSRPART